MPDDGIKELVKEKYGQAALRVTGGGSVVLRQRPSCGCDPVTSNLYAAGPDGRAARRRRWRRRWAAATPRRWPS